MRAYLKLKFNRPINKNTDYISPGGYEVRDVSGNTHQFDFLDSEGKVDDSNPLIVEFWLRNLDTESFPESDKISWNNIVGFEEFFVYLGEPEENNDLEFIELLEFTIDTTSEVFHLPTTIF